MFQSLKAIKIRNISWQLCVCIYNSGIFNDAQIPGNKCHMSRNVHTKKPLAHWTGKWIFIGGKNKSPLIDKGWWNHDLRFFVYKKILNKHYSEKDVRCVEFNSEIGLGSIKLKVKNIIYECDTTFWPKTQKMLSPATWKYCNDEHGVMFTSVLKDSHSSILRVTGFVKSVHCGILNRICLGNWICCLFSGENVRETPTCFNPSERTNVNHWTTHISKTGSVLNTRPWTQHRHSVKWGVKHWKRMKIPGPTL
jgi:hypothetical protein